MNTRLWSAFMWSSMALAVVFLACSNAASATGSSLSPGPRHENAYVTSISFTGSPEDYYVYIAARVMLQSLKRTSPNADVVALVSRKLPQDWILQLEQDGVMPRIVDDIPSPWTGSGPRLQRPLNKLWAWSLMEYQKVVVVDHNNIFVLNTDDLFQCGEFCAVFINPCYFHTGLIVVSPSNNTFNELRRRLPELAKESNTEQQLLNSFYPNLLDGGLFLPGSNNSTHTGLLRLPLGYQMDASFYYYKLRWTIDCSSQSCISFPEVLGLVPWYWYSWPLLPLGFMWHEIRRTTIGYHPEKLWMFVQAIAYMLVAVFAVFVRKRILTEQPLLPSFLPACHLLPSLEGGKTSSGAYIFQCLGLKVLVLGAMGVAFLLPASLIPVMVHPVMGWGLFLLGSLSLLIVLISMMQLPILATLSPWFFTIVALGLMSAHGFVDVPGVSSGLFRFLSIGLLAFLGSPVLYHMLKQTTRNVGPLELAFGRDPLMCRPRQSETSSELAKVC